MSAASPNLNEGSVTRQLLRVSAPMTIGIFSVLAVGLADAFFLARVGQSELAALGFVYPVIVAISAFSVGLSSGANATFSQSRGGGRSETDVGILVLHAGFLGLVFGTTIALVMWWIAPMLFGLLGAQNTVLGNILAYLPWWLASFPLLVLTMILNAAFRAAGDSVTVAGLMVLTAVLNIALTPLLVFGWGFVPGLGMAGAGIATIVARAFVCGMVIVLAFRRDIFVLCKRPWRGLMHTTREVTGTALPAGGSRAINPAGMAVVTAAVATLGEAAVAGFGAASRIQGMSLVPFFALAAGLSPVVGQAWGAEKTDRARDAMRMAAVFTLGYGATLAAILVIFADPLARFMTASDGPAGYTADYLRFVGWSLAGYGMAVVSNAAMTGRSRAGWAMALSLSRITLVYIPFAWIGVMTFGYAGILGASAAANVFALWAALVVTWVTELGLSDARIVSGPGARLCATFDRKART